MMESVGQRISKSSLAALLFQNLKQTFSFTQSLREFSACSAGLTTAEVFKLELFLIILQTIQGLKACKLNAK